MLCCKGGEERTEPQSEALNLLLIFVLTLTYDHRLWITDRSRFLCRVPDISLHDWVKSLAMVGKDAAQTTSLCRGNN